MILEKFKKFFKGYIKIQVEGYYIEKFLTKCVKNGIEVWGLNHKNSTRIEAKVETKDFEKLKEIASSNGCIVTKLKERGLPIIIKKYKKRKGLIIGIILILVAIFALSKFVWKIDIEIQDSENSKNKTVEERNSLNGERKEDNINLGESKENTQEDNSIEQNVDESSTTSVNDPNNQNKESTNIQNQDKTKKEILNLLSENRSKSRNFKKQSEHKENNKPN